MDDPIAVLLKFGFLAVLYLFLLWIARSALKDVAGGQAHALVDDTGPTARPRSAGMDLRSGIFPQLEVVAALGRDPGDRVDVNGGITLGRSPTADIQIDDPFASSAHARIFPRGQFMYIEDMGSTNGVKVNGRRVAEQHLNPGDEITIGLQKLRFEVE